MLKKQRNKNNKDEDNRLKTYEITIIQAQPAVIKNRISLISFLLPRLEHSD